MVCDSLFLARFILNPLQANCINDLSRFSEGICLPFECFEFNITILGSDAIWRSLGNSFNRRWHCRWGLRITFRDIVFIAVQTKPDSQHGSENTFPIGTILDFTATEPIPAKKVCLSLISVRRFHFFRWNQMVLHFPRVRFWEFYPISESYRSIISLISSTLLWRRNQKARYYQLNPYICLIIVQRWD